MKRVLILVLCSTLLSFAFMACSQAESTGGDKTPAVQNLTVTFDTQGGGTVAAQQLAPGTKPTEPTDLTKGDLIFGGWYQEALCTTPWVFTQDPVTENTTLFAKWLPADTLAFNDLGGGTAYSVGKGTGLPAGDLYLPAFYKGIPVTAITGNGFKNITTLGKVRIAHGITTMGDYAFYSSSLTALVVPASLVSLNNKSFWYCYGLASIDVDPANPAYTSVSGILFDKGLTTVLCYPTGKAGSTYVIPDTVTSLAEFSFLNDSNLQGITLPASLTTINYCAFQDCRGLTSIFIPSTVTTVALYAFIGCHSLSIYCQAASLPAGWNPGWNYSNRPVTWGASP